MSTHWNTSVNALIEDANRQLDSSVINALIVGYNDYQDNTFLTTNSTQVANTVATYNTMFCKEYPINVTDNNNKIPGILYGRYQGDHYAGGNPWILSSAALADLYYIAGLNAYKDGGLSTDAFASWKNVLTDLSKYSNTDSKDIMKVFMSAGDSVMNRI